ncbi:hypothetical protein [Fodinicola acaciae]|uniref:hypothetical protein n=1 Tax=Fodinicola acaciae TaxID=2681555 RepID=UPI001651C98B|nr:hypothetical protein [Fodinicola acaciae]
MRLRRVIRPRQVSVNITLPFVGGISGTWEPDLAESKAAWELYVELITRVAVVELAPGGGLLREALSSFYTLFDTSRGILRSYGPAVAPRSRQDAITFGSLSILVLNGAIRPLLTEWHPALQAWEATRADGVAPYDHEQAWPRAAELRARIEQTRQTLADLARVLADVAGAAYLLPEPNDPGNPAGGCPYEFVKPP